MEESSAVVFFFCVDQLNRLHDIDWLRLAYSLPRSSATSEKETAPVITPFKVIQGHRFQYQSKKRLIIIIIIIIIITTTMFMVLSSWHRPSHCESSLGSIDECRLSAGWPPTLRPNQPIWAVSPPKDWQTPLPPSEQTPVWHRFRAIEEYWSNFCFRKGVPLFNAHTLREAF